MPIICIAGSVRFAFVFVGQHKADGVMAVGMPTFGGEYVLVLGRLVG